MAKIVLIAFFILLVIFAVNSEAGMVYGHVYLDGDSFRPGEKFTLSGEGGTFDVETDKYGNYSIVIPPGRYEVRYKGRTTTLKSYPNPSQQDIHLESRR